MGIGSRMSAIASAPAYLRKSRAEDKEDISEVLARHRNVLEETARYHGIIISEYYEEVVSGESLYARPEMLRLLEAVEEGKYEAVFCMDVDRLGRGGMRDQGIILDAFRVSNTLIITPDKVYDLTNDEDEEMTEFKAFFARREYKMIRKRMSRGLLRTIMEGGYVANAPYGYKNVRLGKLPSLEVIPEEAKIVEYIFKRYLEGAGAATIADEVNLTGAKPHRSSKWSRNSIRCILKNPTYCGKVPWNRVRRTSKDGGKAVAKYMPEEDWILADGKHSAIITQEIFDEAQRIRSNRSIPSKRIPDYVSNPMAGLLRCSKCGYNMQMQGKSKGIPYILCNIKGCSAGAKAEYVEASLICSLQKALQRIKLEIKNRTQSRVSEIETLIISVKREIEKFESRRETLFEYLEDGTYSRSEFIERKEKLESSISELQLKCRELERKHMLVLAEDKQKPVTQLENVLEAYVNENPAGKNQLLKSVLEYAYYIKEKKTKPNDFAIVIHLRYF